MVTRGAFSKLALLLLASAHHVASGSPARAGDFLIRKSFLVPPIAAAYSPVNPGSGGASPHGTDRSPAVAYEHLTVVSPDGTPRSSQAPIDYSVNSTLVGATAISADGSYAFTLGQLNKSPSSQPSALFVTNLTSQEPTVTSINLPNTEKCRSDTLAAGAKNPDGTYNLYIGLNCRSGCKSLGNEFDAQSQVSQMTYNPISNLLMNDGESYWTSGSYGDCESVNLKSTILSMRLLDGKLFGVLSQYRDLLKANSSKQVINLVEFGASAIGATVPDDKVTECQPRAGYEFAIISPTTLYGICKGNPEESGGFLFAISGSKYYRGPAVFDRTRNFWDAIVVQPGSRTAYAMLREEDSLLYRRKLDEISMQPNTTATFTLYKLSATNFGVLEQTSFRIQEQRKQILSEIFSTTLKYSQVLIVP